MENKELGSLYVKIMADSSQLREDVSGIRKLFENNLSKSAKNTTENINSGFKKAGKEVKSFNERLKNSIKKSLSLERTMSRLAFIGTVAAFYELGRVIKKTFTDAVKFSIEFEDQMANVYTMLDKINKYMKDELASGVEDIAIKYGQNTDVLTKGLYDILSASIDAADAINVLNEATKAAIAGNTTAAISVDAITGVLNAYGASASAAADVSDLLFAIVKEGKITYEELANNIGKAISSAAILGMSVEQFGATISTMTRQSVRPREAMTAINRLLLQFARNTESARKVATKYNFSLNDLKDPAKGLVYILGKMENATSEEMIALAGSVRAFKAVATGLNDMDEYLKDYEEMIRRTGKTQEALDEHLDTTKVKLNQLKMNFKFLTKDIGDGINTIINSVAPYLSIVLDVFRVFGTGTVFAFKSIKNIVSGIGKLFSGLINYVLTVSMSLAKILTSPWSVFYDVVSSVFQDIYNNFKNIITSIVETFSNIPQLIKAAIKGENIGNALKDIWSDVDFDTNIKQILNENIDKVKDAGKDIFGATPELIDNVTQTTKETIGILMKDLKITSSLMRKLIYGVQDYGEKTKEITQVQSRASKDHIDDLITERDKIFDTIEALEIKREIAKETGGDEKAILKEIINEYVKLLDVLISLGESEAIINRVVLAIARLKNELNESGESFKTFKEYFMSGVGKIKEAWEDYAFTIKDVFDAAIDSISSGWNSLWRDILDGQNMMKKNWAKYLRDIVNQFILAINQMIAKWLAFYALSSIFGFPFSFAGGALSGGGSIGASAWTNAFNRFVDNAYSPNSISPIINVNPVMEFDRRSQAFVVKQGLQEINRTTL